MKGSAITSRLRYLDEHAPSRREDIFASLAVEHRAILKAGVLKNAWVPYSLFIELNVRLDEELGTGDLQLCRTMGAYGARVNLPTIYRLFYKVGSFGFILKRAARIWDIHYSSGKLFVESGSDWAKLRIEGFELPHDALWLSVQGWAEASAELSGVVPKESMIITSPTEPGEACEIRIRW